MIRSGAMLPLLRTAVVRALDAVVPPRCLSCGRDVAESGSLCQRCWGDLAFIADPMCRRCGLPFETAPVGEILCGACVARPPGFDRARAVFAYDDASRDLVLGFKHGDRTDAAPGLGQWLCRAGGDLIRAADVIVPVPLHPWRLVRRRYNQSALLVLAITRRTGKVAAVDLLERNRATQSQGGLGAAARRHNVGSAFSVRSRYRPWIADRRVLIVDDVLTTGATVEACAGALTRAGAGAVDVLTLARVVGPRAVQS